MFVTVCRFHSSLIFAGKAYPRQNWGRSHKSFWSKLTLFVSYTISEDWEKNVCSYETVNLSKQGENNYTGLHSIGRLCVSSANNRLGRKELKVTNPLAYYDMAWMTAVKSFIVQAYCGCYLDMMRPIKVYNITKLIFMKTIGLHEKKKTFLFPFHKCLF